MVATERRIYVACLASYNNGVLHGVWIDLEGKDADAVNEEIAAMLRESKYPNVEVDCPNTYCDGGKIEIEKDLLGTCETCKGTGKVPSAEEWAIHDHEGIGKGWGENPDLDALCEFVEVLEEHGEAYSAYVDHVGLDYATKEAFEEAYCGTHASPKDYAEEFFEDCYSSELDAMPSLLRHNIDWEGIAEEFRIGGDVFYIDCAEGVHVFRNV